MLRLATLASAAALIATAAAQAGKPAPLVLLTDPAAKCMDGTQSGYYHQPYSTPAASTKWVFMLDGGGECATQQACQAQIKTPLGSSNYFSKTSYFNGMYYASDNQAENPDFWAWNHVHVPYCSQDLHTGQVTAPSNNTWGLYFSGHLVFRAILDALESSGGLSNASEIILTGASAGGIGVWPNLDYLAERYPAARVVGAPVAGFYFYAYPYQGVNHTSSSLADFRPAAWPGHYALWQSFVDESCAAANPTNPSFCLLSNNSFPYVSAESYAVEAQTDQVVLTDHNWVPQSYVTLPPEQSYLGQWRDNMTVALAPLMNRANPRNGAFNPACFIHTSFSPAAPLINGMNFLKAFGNWYYQRTAPSGYKLADTCGIMCNPTCP